MLFVATLHDKVYLSQPQGFVLVLSPALPYYRLTVCTTGNQYLMALCVTPSSARRTTSWRSLRTGAARSSCSSMSRCGRNLVIICCCYLVQLSFDELLCWVTGAAMCSCSSMSRCAWSHFSLLRSFSAVSYRRSVFICFLLWQEQPCVPAADITLYWKIANACNNMKFKVAFCCKASVTSSAGLSRSLLLFWDLLFSI